jgi:hypothetical protein
LSKGAEQFSWGQLYRGSEPKSNCIDGKYPGRVVVQGDSCLDDTCHGMALVWLTVIWGAVVQRVWEAIVWGQLLRGDGQLSGTIILREKIVWEKIVLEPIKPS